MFHVFCLCNFGRIHSNGLKVWFNNVISFTSGIQIKQILHESTVNEKDSYKVIYIFVVRYRIQ
jgi:hypothetical protein